MSCYEMLGIFLKMTNTEHITEEGWSETEEYYKMMICNA
jgi:hypothetical protein